MLEIAPRIELVPDFGLFLGLALAGLALNLIPGADMGYVIASAARGGSRSGLAAALGIGAGALFHILAAVVGLSALIASSHTAFTVLKWVGAGTCSTSPLAWCEAARRRWAPSSSASRA